MQFQEATVEEFFSTYASKNPTPELHKLMKAILHGFQRTPTSLNDLENRMLKDRPIRRSIEKRCEGWESIPNTFFDLVWRGVRVSLKIQNEIWPYRRQKNLPIQLKNPHDNGTKKRIFCPRFDVLMAVQSSNAKKNQPFAVGFMSANLILKKKDEIIKETGDQFRLEADVGDWVICDMPNVVTDKYSSELSVIFESQIDDMFDRFLDYKC